MQPIFIRSKTLLIISLVIIIFIVGIGIAFSLPVQRYSKLHKVVVLDPGHGSIDSGAHYNNLYEKDINLEIAYILKDLLEKSNMEVIMTRTDDSLYNQSRREDIIYRARKTREVKADIFISIHVNKFPTAEPFGGQVYYCTGEESKLLADLIQEQLKIIQPDNYRSVGRGSYYVLKRAPCPAVLVEVGFISNPIDRQRITDPNEQLKIANAIRSGLVTFFHDQFSRGTSMITENSTPEDRPMLSENNIPLYFIKADQNGEKLVYQSSSIMTEETISVSNPEGFTTLERRAILALQTLFDGPKIPGFISAIPPESKIHSLHIKDGVATLNVSKEIATNHWGGAQNARYTIEAITKTLTAFSEINQVQILINGQKDQTLTGHLILDELYSAESFE